MGVDIGDLVEKHETSLDEVSGKVGIDAFNAIYGFLANIRQPDGTPLKDSRGRVTSHLSGILYRTANLFEAGIKPCYVFDGQPPDLKSDTIEKREERRTEAQKAYEKAKEEGDKAEMFKRAQQATRIDDAQVESSVKLLNALNVPWVEAPTEGEAQAAHMSKKGDLDYVGSQDYDSLLFGSPELVRNLTIRGRGGRELPPEIIYLDETLEKLGITLEQLIEIAILIGTDYNEGVHGVGPKTALKTIKEKSIEEALDELDADIDWEPIKELYTSPSVTDDYGLEWGAPDYDEVIDLLCGQHDFSEDRVRGALDRINATATQSSLDRWS